MIEFRQCGSSSCQLRFPAAAAEMVGDACPSCGSQTHISNSKPDPDWVQEKPRFRMKRKMVGILDNIRSAYNAGSLIRTADGAGLKHLYFCGITPPPDHPKVAKTALGSESAVEISRYRNGLHLTDKLKEAGYYLIALEKEVGAISLFDQKLTVPDQPLALIIGNENSGIDPGILANCHIIVDLPMMGVKQSLNVVVAFGIAVYHLNYCETF